MKIDISRKGRKHIGKTTTISDCDRDLAKISWSCIQVANSPKGRLYAVHTTTKKTAALFGIGAKKAVYLHRVILARKLNVTYADLIAAKWQADHKDSDGLNNCRSNIRKADKYQNRWNSQHGAYKGVYRRANDKFYSAIRSKGVFYYLGTFDTAEEAKAARDEKAKQLHGRFFRP